MNKLEKIAILGIGLAISSLSGCAYKPASYSMWEEINNNRDLKIDSKYFKDKKYAKIERLTILEYEKFEDGTIRVLYSYDGVLNEQQKIFLEKLLHPQSNNPPIKFK